MLGDAARPLELVEVIRAHDLGTSIVRAPRDDAPVSSVSDCVAAEFINTLRGGGDNPAHSKDAVLIATARYENAVFVTCDRRARNAAERNGVRAVSPAELIQLLRT